MYTINQIANLLRVIIPIACVCRIVFCLIKMAMDEDGGMYKTRIWHTLIFSILAVASATIADIVTGYYK